MIIWIDRALVIAIHERQLSEHGGGSGLRDKNLLDAALARPRHLHAYGQPSPDLADLAASLAFGLARDHPFVDANKRTAHVCYRVFFALNSVELVASDEGKYLAMIALAEGRLSEAEFAQWLRKRITHNSTNRLNEPRSRYAR
ncbi:MAG: type II toxin-antitoxin system death-on-curing family toxin [Dokdonella sp.]